MALPSFASSPQPAASCGPCGACSHELSTIDYTCPRCQCARMLPVGTMVGDVLVIVRWHNGEFADTRVCGFRTRRVFRSKTSLVMFVGRTGVLASLRMPSRYQVRRECYAFTLTDSGLEALQFPERRM